jgi:hydrogenase-4 component H
MILSKLKEAWICIKAGRVTLPYPFAPLVPEEGFRGRVTVDAERCIGCGGCANVCTPRCIIVSDPSQEVRQLDFFLERCTYCTRCAEVCPEKAITVTKEFETATNSTQDLHLRVEVFMGTCQRCGRCFEFTTPLDKMMVTGFRDGQGEQTAEAVEACETAESGAGE